MASQLHTGLCPTPHGFALYSLHQSSFTLHAKGLMLNIVQAGLGMSQIPYYVVRWQEFVHPYTICVSPPKSPLSSVPFSPSASTPTLGPTRSGSRANSASALVLSETGNALRRAFVALGASTMDVVEKLMKASIVLWCCVLLEIHAKYTRTYCNSVICLDAFFFFFF